MHGQKQTEARTLSGLGQTASFQDSFAQHKTANSTTP